MTDTPPSFKDLSVRTPFIVPIKGSGFIYQGSGLYRERRPSVRNASSRCRAAAHAYQQGHIADIADGKGELGLRGRRVRSFPFRFLGYRGVNTMFFFHDLNITLM